MFHSRLHFGSQFCSFLCLLRECLVNEPWWGLKPPKPSCLGDRTLAACTLPNPALHPSLPAQDCVPGQRLFFFLGTSLIKSCFLFVQEQIDCLFSWDKNFRYEVKAELWHSGSICNAQDSTGFFHCTA